MGIKRERLMYQILNLLIDFGIELSQIIHEHAPDAVKTGEIKNQFGRKVAIVCVTPVLKCLLKSR